MSTAHLRADGGSPTGLWEKLTRFGIIAGVALWIGLFPLAGFHGAGTALFNTVFVTS